jgi:hypothetical protein
MLLYKICRTRGSAFSPVTPPARKNLASEDIESDDTKDSKSLSSDNYAGYPYLQITDLYDKAWSFASEKLDAVRRNASAWVDMITSCNL